MKIGFPVSLSILFWGMMAFLRAISERIFPKQVNKKVPDIKKRKKRIAVCVPAHNEEKTLEATLSAILVQLPPSQVHVVSDNSTDRTAEIAKGLGCQVLALTPSHGKARALEALIAHFKLEQKYDFILFVDADTELDSHYVEYALKVFANDEKAAAIAAYAIPLWNGGWAINQANFISAYRTKLYQILQLFFMYGQTWKRTNTNPVIPGFAAMYRTRVLKQLDIATPGLLIEDFNLAFQIHKKKLGYIAHYRQIAASYHDPITISDYIKQIQRWNLGFYQTVRRHGIWPSLFWVSTGLFAFELFLSALFSLFVPLLTFFVVGWTLLSNEVHVPIWVSQIYVIVLQLWMTIAILIILDYALTVYIALKDRKFSLLLLGLGFGVFHFINSAVLLWSIPQGLLKKSAGNWQPAKR